LQEQGTRGGPYSLPEAHEGANNAERGRDKDPEGQETNKCREGDGGGGARSHEEEVEDDENEGEGARNQGGAQKDATLPGLTAKHLVEAGRGVTAGVAEAHVEGQGHGNKTAADGGGEKAEEGEGEGDEAHKEDLHPVAGEHGEEDRAVGGPEDITVHQLPAVFFLGLFLRGVVVARDVQVKGAKENHGNHEGEEDDNDKGVDEAEPVDLGIINIQVAVPAGVILLVRPLLGREEKKKREKKFKKKKNGFA